MAPRARFTVCDPNFFGGTVEVASKDGKLKALKPWKHPFGKVNQNHNGRELANYRTAGLADMVTALVEGRDARCSLERALHGVDVMTACLTSGETGKFVTLTTTCTRPAALSPSEARALLKEHSRPRYLPAGAGLAGGGFFRGLRPHTSEEVNDG